MLTYQHLNPGISNFPLGNQSFELPVTMQQSAGLPVGQQDRAQVTHPAPAIVRIANIHENPSVHPPQLRGYLEEAGGNGGCTYGRLYSSVDHGQTEPGDPSQYLDSVLATLPRKQPPLRLRGDTEESRAADRSIFDRTFELLAMGIPQQPNTLRPSPESTNTAEGHEEASPMLQRYIDYESGKDGGSVYARLFETLDTLKAMENLHDK